MKCLCFFSFPKPHTVAALSCTISNDDCWRKELWACYNSKTMKSEEKWREFGIIWNLVKLVEFTMKGNLWKSATCEVQARPSEWVRYCWWPVPSSVGQGQQWTPEISRLLFDTKRRNQKNRNQKSHFLGKSVKKFRLKIDDGLFVLETGEVWPHIQFLSIEKGRQNGLRKSFIPTDLNEEHRNFESANPSRIQEIKAERNMSKIKKISKKSRCQNAIWDDLSHPLVSHRHCESPLHPSHKIQDCFSTWCCSFGILWTSLH